MEGGNGRKPGAGETVKGAEEVEFAEPEDVNVSMQPVPRKCCPGSE
jgi:hypothetical protein